MIAPVKMMGTAEPRAFASESLAVISDIHGNRWALEAVLNDIENEGITTVINLGDVLYGPLDPAGTANLLVERAYPTVRGNEDRIITDSDSPRSATLMFVRAALSRSHLEWLSALEPTGIHGDAFLCHGAPGSDSSYLLWDLGPTGARTRKPADVAKFLTAIDSPLVLCGHDHVPQVMQLPDGRTVVNPGSVGLPAYLDTYPYPHVMMTGSPHARYAVISQSGLDWSVSDRMISYDWQAAAYAAHRNGRPDWAAWLQSGQAML